MRQFILFGKKPKYETLSWWENFMGGHLNIGNVTIYGENAMCWSVNIRTKRWGVVCFTLPSITRKKYKQGHYFYLSPNGTPWASTFYRGYDKQEVVRAQIRKMNFGHNFKVNDSEIYKKLRCVNIKFEWFRVSDYDLHKFSS